MALGSFLLWGGLVIYWHALIDVDPLEVLSHRAIWSFIFMLILCIALKKFGEIKNVITHPKYIVPLIVSSILIGSNWGLFIWAVGNEKIIESAMGNYITPLLNMLASAIIFKVKLNKYQIIAILSVAIGVLYMIVGYGEVPYIALFFAVTFCAYGIIKKLVHATAVTGMFIETLFMSIPCTIYVLFLIGDGNSALLNGSVLTTLLLIGAGVMTTLPLIGFTYSAQRLHLSTIGVLQYISPTISFLIGVFLYKEPFSTSMLITFCFIWLGLLIYTINGIIVMKLSKKEVKSTN